VAPILVVDDDPAILDMVTWALTEEGYEVAGARHGAEALDLVERQPPKLVLLDMTMPVMDGWEFSRRLRKAHGRSIPIVCMTAAKDARTRAEDIQAEAFLAKPFDLDDLFDCVHRFVNGGTAQAR